VTVAAGQQLCGGAHRAVLLCAFFLRFATVEFFFNRSGGLLANDRFDDGLD
jgi:hypothetical protein